MINRKNLLPIGLTIFGLLLGGVTTAQALYYNPQEEMPVSDPGISFASHQESIPVHIFIPEIKVNTEVEQVGLTYKGNMSTPKKLYNAGWYKYGTKPGQRGSSVIDGHVDNGLGLPGVFVDLKKLSPGSDIYVTTENGDKLHFKVTHIERYYYQNLPLTDIFNKADGKYLNLITCDGDWIPEADTSDHRIVVYSELVN